MQPHAAAAITWQRTTLPDTTGSSACITTATYADPGRRRPGASVRATIIVHVTYVFNLKGLKMKRDGCLYIFVFTFAFWAIVAGLLILFS
jgi:hypothetical protein